MYSLRNGFRNPDMELKQLYCRSIAALLDLTLPCRTHGLVYKTLVLLGMMKAVKEGQI